MKKTRVYLDNCCYNRPFDDQESLTIRLESEAKMMIQSKIKSADLELVWSYILDFENQANPDEEIKFRISKWRDLAVHIQLGSDSVISRGKEFRILGLSDYDSIHLACAIESKSDLFITTDKGILKKRDLILDLKIINPLEFFINQEERE